MRRGESLEKRGRRRSHSNVLPIVGGALLALFAVGVLTQLHDIRRYINMIRM